MADAKEKKAERWGGIEKLAQDCSALPAKYFGEMAVDDIGALLREHRESIAAKLKALVPLLEAAEAKLECKYRSPKMRQKVNDRLREEIAKWK